MPKKLKGWARLEKGLEVGVRLKRLLEGRVRLERLVEVGVRLERFLAMKASRVLDGETAWLHGQENLPGSVTW